MRNSTLFKNNKKETLRGYLVAQLLERKTPRVKKSSIKLLEKSNFNSELILDNNFVFVSSEFNSFDDELFESIRKSVISNNNNTWTIGLTPLKRLLKIIPSDKNSHFINVIIGDDLVNLLQRRGASNEKSENYLEEISELISSTIQMENINFYFSVTLSNLYWVDDVFLYFSKLKQNRIIFCPSKSLLNYFNTHSKLYVKEHFHISLFFENLSRQKNYSLELRFFYKTTYSVVNSIELLDSCIAKVDNWMNLLPNPKKDNSFDTELWLLGFVELFRKTTIPNIFRLIASSLKSRLSSDNNIGEYTKNQKCLIPIKLNPRLWKTVLITGWYGTETQGDKAIIGEILHFIKSASPDCKIILTTLHSVISEQTNLELENLFGVQLIKLTDSHIASTIIETDAVIIGGGPLMESASMKNLGFIFNEALQQNIPRIIFGCGIGPIHSKEVKEIARFLINVCNAGFVRDKESFEFATKLFPNHNLKFACDPAVGYITRWRRKNNMVYSSSGCSTMATLLRANTNEFSPESNPESLRVANEKLAKKIAEVLDKISIETGTAYSLLHMNAPWIGGDDRIYNRILESQLSQKTKVSLIREYMTIEEHLLTLSKSHSAIAMRYHGHIFCMAMGIPFISLDYTGKSGKVSSLVNRIGYSQWSIKWDDIDPITMTNTYKRLMLESGDWSKYLISESDKLVQLLEQTYKEVFNYCPEN